MMRLFLLSLTSAILAACSPAAPAELTVSLQSSLPGAGHQLGGSVDTVVTDSAAGLVTISGWHMMTPKTRSRELRVYAPEALGVESVTGFPRPDVVSALGKDELLETGYRIVLRIEPGTEFTQLCISMTDKQYGARILTWHSSEPPHCPLVG